MYIYRQLSCRQPGHITIGIRRAMRITFTRALLSYANISTRAYTHTQVDMPAHTKRMRCSNLIASPQKWPPKVAPLSH